MPSKSDRHQAQYIPFRCERETYEAIQKIAVEKNWTNSEVLRFLVRKGLVSCGYQQDEDQLLTTMKLAVQEVIKPHVERLASISAKATQISSAEFFFLVYLGRLFLPNGEHMQLEEVAARSRQLGIEYLKLAKNRDIDDFIEDGINKLIND